MGLLSQLLLGEGGAQVVSLSQGTQSLLHLGTL